MGLNIVFIVVVVLGFAFWMAASFGQAWADRAAKVCFFVASLLWALTGIK
jgi:hypothetical protein